MSHCWLQIYVLLDFKSAPRNGILWRVFLVAQSQAICPPHRKHEFNPWLRKIPRGMEQQSLCATGTKAACPKACAPQEKWLQWEACARPLEDSLQLQTAHTQQQRPSIAPQKTNFKNKFFLSYVIWNSTSTSIAVSLTEKMKIILKSIFILC